MRDRHGHLRTRRGSGEGKTHITMQQMRSGQSGNVVHITGGTGLVNRLNALGIRPGVRITKVSSMFMRGPVTIQVGRTQAAIGHGMSHKIFVEVD
jgi:ferrous iron transport protein A